VLLSVMLLAGGAENSGSAAGVVVAAVAETAGVSALRGCPSYRIRTESHYCTFENDYSKIIFLSPLSTPLVNDTLISLTHKRIDYSCQVC
jgi:hypothetical protein